MPARRNSLCKYVKASFQSCFWINMLWKWSWNNHPASQSPTHTWLTRSQSIFICYFIIHYIFFSCMFVLRSQIIWGMFSVFVLWSILRLAGLCVMVRFLSALLLRVHMACYREVRVDSYSVLACFGFYFQKDKGLDLLTSESYQCKILIKWASLNVECTK